jgi:DNA helicase-2/ATP-dependent DNA helicase PcrA
MASRFLAEVPQRLLEDLSQSGSPIQYVSEGYNQDVPRAATRLSTQRLGHNSADNIASFFKKRETDDERQPAPVPNPRLVVPPRATTASGKFRVRPVESGRGLRLGSRVRHPQWGTGTVMRVEGQGDDTKLTVSFPRVGVKKMVEKYAGLEPI